MIDPRASQPASWPQRTPAAHVASLGVTATKGAVEGDLDWLFREQPTEDYGIDAQVEVVDGSDVRGRLLALQIKSGTSWFDSPAQDGWWFRPEPSHVQYWTNHSLPVAVVLYHPMTETCHWQLINSRTLQRSSRGGWKVLVPRTQVLNASAREPLREAAEGDPYVLRIRELQLARPWMERLQHGERLVVEMEEWVNKTSGRGSIALAIDHEDGIAPEEIASWTVMLPYADYATVVPHLFAWADVTLHEETYDEADWAQYEAECVTYDNEGDRFAGEEFSEWKAAQGWAELRPYANPSGEVAMWRLELTLSDLGKAFLLVDRFATRGLHEITP